MKIEPKSIKVRAVFENYADNGDDGVVAYGGRLAIVRHISVNLYMTKNKPKRLFI